jgi:hypothetical protein
VNPDQKGRASLVSVITTPLGFFALSLLIVEGFLGIILVGSDLEKWQKFTGLLIGAVLFILIVVLVTVLVWKKPQHLTFSERSHLEHDKEFGALGSKQITEKQLQNEPKVSDDQTTNIGGDKK